MITFSQILLKLQQFWANKDVILFNLMIFQQVLEHSIPATFKKFRFNTLEYSLCAPSRRPTDGRYGENPNRLGAYYQFQVLIKTKSR